MGTVCKLGIKVFIRESDSAPASPGNDPCLVGAFVSLVRASRTGGEQHHLHDSGVGILRCRDHFIGRSCWAVTGLL